MSARHIAVPDGCLNCNREQRQLYLDKLRALEIHVEPVPMTLSSDVVVCRRCGQAWLIMPREQNDLPT